MSNVSYFDAARNRFRAGLADVDRHWGWYFALGIFLIVLGVIATSMAVATTIISVIALGWIMLGAGIGLAILSFLAGNWSGFLLTLAAGVLSGIAGISILSSPLSGAAAITLMVGTILIAAGIYRAVASVALQFPNWGFSLVSGVASFVLGVLLLRSWQTSSLFFLGLYIGIDLIIHVFSWMMFSTRVHRLAGQAGISEADRRRAA
jgi:uncharacterized membrane protein HdeD (DUF308 family)